MARSCAIGFAIGIARGAWRDDRRSIVIVTMFLALAFFMLPTRVHERYMFPIFGLLPLMAAVSRRWLWAAIALSIAAFINLHGILTIVIYATPNLEHLPLGEFFREPIAVVTSIVLHVAGFAFIAWKLMPSAADERDPYASRVPLAPAVGALSEATGLPEDGTATGALGAPASLAAAAALNDQSPAVEDDIPPEAVMVGVRRWLRRFIGTKSVRRDRSFLLIGELGGRLDRRDALMLLLVFMSTLLLRTYRLEVPYSMHFDEVYHARTATEFLQDWRYGMPQGIYEYTHPHLAKYSMALGIEALGNNRVTNTRDLGVNVKDAAIERRWSPPDNVNQRYGDRLYLVTDSGVRAYDMATRVPVGTIDGNFDLIAIDQGSHVMYLADKSGSIWTVDTTQFDGATTTAPASAVAEPLTALSDVNGEVTHLAVAGQQLVATTDDGQVIGLDLGTGDEIGRASYPDPTAAAGVSAKGKVMVDPAQVTDPAAFAETLSGLIDRDAFAIETAIRSTTEPVPVAAFISKSARADLQKKIDDGEIDGVSIEDGSAIAVGLSTGVVLIDAASFRELAFFGTFDPVTDLTLVTSGPEHPTIYATAGDKLINVILPNDDAARLSKTIQMPNAVERVVWNDATTNVHVLGQSQDGTSPTVYVVEPRSNSIFADARLTAEPQAVVMDVQRDRPAEDRNDLLAISPTGQIATVDTGNNQFAYRFPGVLLGALMAVCIYLLARFLFNRRSVAVIAFVLVLADGMMFANARIAMNDTYVAFFIVAAFTLFVPVWLGRWRSRLAIASALAGVGVLLGLALASKWVGAYAIGAVGLLILLRSALGRMIALRGDDRPHLRSRLHRHHAQSRRGESAAQLPIPGPDAQPHRVPRGGHGPAPNSHDAR